jgi:ferredoxin--NADP+ reductase
MRSLLGTKAVGTLVLDALLPGKRLYLLSTGTGIAPFASIIRDPETYERYEQVILTHTCREVAELTYGKELVDAVREDPLVGEFVGDKLVYYPSVTREPFERQGRITTLMDDGVIYQELGIPALNPETDRVMICGSMEMLEDCKARCEQAGLTEGSNARPAEFVIEKGLRRLGASFRLAAA